MKRREGLSGHHAVLGVKADAMIAVELGLTAPLVAGRRQGLGIPGDADRD